MRPRAAWTLLIVGLLATIVACGGGTASPPGNCRTEPRAAGTLPDLEALLPEELNDTTIDSGWNCLPTTLRSYARHGVTRLEFAGATREEGGGNGTVIAVLRSGPEDPALEAAWVEEFYEGSARESGRVDNIEVRRATIGTAGDVWRLDALNNLSLQTIVVWQAGSVVRTVIVASDVGPDADRSAHDERVTLAVDAAERGADPAGVPQRSSVLPSRA